MTDDYAEFLRSKEPRAEVHGSMAPAKAGRTRQEQTSGAAGRFVPPAWFVAHPEPGSWEDLGETDRDPTPGVLGTSKPAPSAAPTHLESLE